MSYYSRSLRMLGVAALAGIAFIVVNVALRVGILKACGPNHVGVAIVVAWVARLLLILGYCLLLRRLVPLARAESRAPKSN